MVKLAFWDTVGEAYRFVFTQPLTIMRAGWAVLAIDFVNLLLPAAGIKSAALQVLLAVIVYVLFIGIAVAWHIALARAILLGESSWLAALRFHRRQWRLIGVSLLFTVLVGVPVAIGAIAVAVAHPAGIVVAPFAIVFLALCIVVIAAGVRFYLVIPAIAIDDPAKAIRAAWRRGQRNTLRLFFGVLICLLPVFLIVWIGAFAFFSRWIGFLNNGNAPDPNAALGFFFRSHPAMLAAIAGGGTLLSLLASALFIAFYALAYRQIAANWNPPPAIAARLET